MENECKILLDTAVDAETRNQATPNATSRSKLTTALLALTLCVAAATAAVLVFNRHAKGPAEDTDDQDLRHTLRQISAGRAAIHLQGKYNPNMSTSVEWLADVDQSYSQGGLRLVNNEIVIPRNGLYFIYSQASFRVSCSSSEADDTSRSMVHLSHSVRRWSDAYGGYEPILHSVRTACQKTASNNSDEQGNWFSAVYMGAVFNLNEGDRLKTQMEEKMLPNLEEDSGKTFFGVFAL